MSKSLEAFDEYCRDPIVQHALSLTKGTLALDLLRDCFMHGAKHAVERCKAAGHTPPPRAAAEAKP